MPPAPALAATAGIPGLGIAAIGASLLGGAASIIGGKKAADAIKDQSQIAEGITRDTAATSLELQRPHLEVGVSALGQLAKLFGLPEPEPLDFGSIQRSINPTAENLVPVPGQPRMFADPVTGQGYMLARKGGNAGQLVQVGQRFPELIDPTLSQGPQGSTGSGFSSLEDLLNNNPGIQHVQEQGEQAIARGAAARGINQSGATLKDLSRFNQGQAATNFENLVLDPLFQLAGFGGQAAGNSTNVIQNSGTNLANLALDAGNARASAFQNTGNQVGNILTDIGSGLFKLSNNNPSGSGFDPTGIVPFT